MTLTRRTSPLGELLSFRSAMDRLFDETVFRPVAGNGLRTMGMPLDISSTPEALVIEAALPGVRPEDVDVSVLGNTLTLTANHEANAESGSGRYHVREVRRGRASRTVTLPDGLRTDAASATFEHGMLKLSIPRAEEAKPLQIPVTVPVEGASADASTVAASGEQPAAG